LSLIEEVFDLEASSIVKHLQKIFPTSGEGEGTVTALFLEFTVYLIKDATDVVKFYFDFSKIDHVATSFSCHMASFAQLFLPRIKHALLYLVLLTKLNGKNAIPLDR
jgi:hypothetical protein